MPKNERGWWCPKTFPAVAAFAALSPSEQDSVIAANKVGFAEAVELLRANDRLVNKSSVG